ncbi:hypothetical protein QZH41_004182 [Actinostola sp. cb2023]|nr:hypothetical protein QZH41_004182 [Actinostola sp. cb2023]
MRLICPICEMKKVRIPATFRSVDSSIHEGVCKEGWHKIGTINDILRGKYSPGDFVASELHQATRIGGEIPKDQICPKLFIVLPINNECLSFKDRLDHTYLRDGYAVHLLCECPDQWHFVDSPGFRIGKPKEFFEKYGKHLYRVVRTIAKLGAPLRVAACVHRVMDALGRLLSTKKGRGQVHP